MFAFLATQYLYIFSATVTLTYTLEVLVVLTTVVLANILVLAVTGLLRYGFGCLCNKYCTFLLRIVVVMYTLTSLCVDLTLV